MLAPRFPWWLELRFLTFQSSEAKGEDKCCFPIEGWQGLPAYPRGRQKRLVSFSPSHASGGKQPAQLFHCLQEAPAKPPILRYTHLTGRLQPQLPVLKIQGLLSPRFPSGIRGRCGEGEEE